MAVAYLNGQYVPREQVRVSPDDRGFLFGDGVYEFVRFYAGRPFAMDRHLARLARSLAALRIDGVDVAPLANVFERLAAESGVPDTGVYLQVTRGAAPRRHRFPDTGTPPTIYAFADPTTFSPSRWETGVSVVTTADQRWARCDVKSLQLLANVLANQRAHEAGVEECLFVRDGFVTEGSHTNVFAVFDGRLATYPDSPYILPGVTRAIVLELAARLDIAAHLRPIPYDSLLAADEVFITSTSEEVLPVVSIDGRSVASGAPGPVSQSLLAAFRAEAGVG